MNRHFQAKLVKYQHFNIIETTASIPTKFCTVINRTNHQMIISQNARRWWTKHVYNKSKVADGHRFWKKNKNLHISATVWPMNTKFCTLTHTDPLNTYSYKFHSLKVQDDSSIDFHKIWQDDAFWSSLPVDCWVLKIQDGGRPPFWKPLNRHNSATVWRIVMKFGLMTHFNPLKPTYDQNYDF